MPVTHVTNGVHMPTWDSAEADRVWDVGVRQEPLARSVAQARCKDCELRSDDSDLWDLRAESRRSFSLTTVRRLYARQSAARGAASEDVARAALVLDRRRLDPGILPAGFATYKRPNLLLHDPALAPQHPESNREHPVQLVLAGEGASHRMSRGKT